MSKKINIGVIGLWHLGCVYSASLAKLGFEVTCYDESSSIITDLEAAKPPIEEPGLTDTIATHINKNLFFTSDIANAVKDKEYIFITYDIPVNEKDEIDLGIINRTTKLLERHLSPGTTIVISSQLPIGSSRALLKTLVEKQPSTKLIYFPENLRLGTAFESFLKADRVVIGSDSLTSLDKFEKDFTALKTTFIKIGLESAEMVKHMLNTYLATLISLSSEMSDISELFGANMNEVVRAIKSDKRVSPNAPLNPGLGFAGGTLGRDLQTLKKVSSKLDYETKLINAVYSVNQSRITQLAAKISKTLGKSSHKTIGILGLTYKPKTNTLRRSMSLDLAKLLHSEGYILKAFDPAIKVSVDGFKFLKVESSEEDFFTKLDLVVLMTDWDEFKKLDWKKLSVFPKTKNIIDCKNWLLPTELTNAGWNYQGIGI